MNKLDFQQTEQRIFGKILQRQARENGDTAYLITDHVRISFAEAEEITNRLAAGLRALGVARGDRIALLLGNVPEMVLLALAINKLGAVWVPINTEYKGEWLADHLLRCRAKLLIVDDKLQSRLAELPQPEIQQLAKVLVGDKHKAAVAVVADYQDLLQHQPLQTDYADQHYGDTCAILWTSGTTGKSKGVMQSYNAWIRAIWKGSSLQYDSQPGDIIYCVLPLYNSGAWITSVLRALLEGIPVVIEEKFSVQHFWQRIAHFQATQSFAVGAMGVFLYNAPEQPDDAATPLRVLQIVPLPPQLWEPFARRFNLRLLRTGLGLSECLLVLTQLEARDDVPVYALGFPVDDTEIALLDDAGEVVADGEVGEICVKALEPYTLFNGYFDDPEATAAAFMGEWFRSGDLGRKDPQSGAFFYADRKKDAVRFAGRNISTLEVESVVMRHPAVKEVAAFGIPSQEVASEDELKLNIVLKQGQQLSHEALCAFINENAPYYFVPRYMEFVESLPYTPTNKVQKYKLRQQGVTKACWDLRNSSYQVQR